MKKNRLRYMILVGLMPYINGFVFAADDEKHPIQEHTFLVYRRYYFVARLDKTIKLLAKMYQEVTAMQSLLKEKAIENIVPRETYQLFTHKQIRSSVKEIEQTRSLKPLFMVWDSFKSYKSLRDDLLVEDFSKEIFIVTRNALKNLYTHDVNRYCSLESDTALCHRLDILANMTDQLESLLNGNTDFLPVRANMADVHLAVHTDEVAFRFYCIHRLRAALDYLLSMPEREKSFEDIYSALQVRLCIDRNVHKKISSHKSLKKIWDDVLQYKYIDHDQYIHNFAVYVCMLLHCRSSSVQVHKALSHSDIIAMQHRIEQLPLEDILKTIDLIVKQIHTAADHYHKSGMTFNQWIKHYWWAPTAICVTIVIKCFTLYYKNFTYSERSIPS